MLPHRGDRTAHIFIRICAAQRQGFLQLHAIRNVTVQGIVRAGLVRQNIGHNAAAHQFRQHIRAIAHQADRKGLCPLKNG